MPSYVPPKKNTEYIFYIGLPAQGGNTFQSNPTIAAGDFKVSTDGGTLGNLTTLPTVTPASGKMVKITLSATEMNGDNVTVVCSDAAGSEWDDVIINIQTSATQQDDTRDVNVLQISGDATAADNLESFFDGTGYNASNSTVGTVTTLTGHTAQTGDSYARLGAPAGASVSADIAAVKSDTAAILTDTAEIGTAGAGLTGIPWNASWDAEVQSEVEDGLIAHGLDHLVGASVADTDVADNSIIAKLVDSTSITADFTNYDWTTDSLRALRDRGDAAWITATGFSTHSAADVWTAGTRTLTANTNLNDPTAATIADAVWDELQSAHVTAGSFGEIATEIADILTDTNELQTNQGNWLTATGFSTHSAADVADAVWDELQADHVTANTFGVLATEIADILVDTNSLNDTKIPDTISLANINAEVDTAFTDYDPPTKTEMDTAFTDIKGATWSSSTDTLEAIRDRGDAAWTTGGGGSNPILLQNTTIATLASQTSFTLTAGSADDDAYNGCFAVITDSTTAEQKAVARISDYTGSTKTVTLNADPAIFTMAVGDTIDILANALPYADEIRTEMDSNSTQLAAIVADTNELQTNQGNWLTATGFSTHSAADVWTAGTRTLTANTNLNDPTAATIADAVWDELQSGHVTAGSFGEIATEIASILVDTAEIGTAGAGLTAVPWNAAWDAEVQSEVNDGLVAYNAVATTDLPTNFSDLSITLTTGRVDVASIEGVDATDQINAACDTALTDYDAPTKAEMDTLIGTPAGASVSADIASIQTDTTAIVADTGTDGVVLAASQVAIKKNTALANFSFVMTDDTNHVPTTGYTVTAQRSIDGAAFASCANSVTELGNGVYVINLAASDLNGDVITLRFTATNADDQLITIVTQ